LPEKFTEKVYAVVVVFAILSIFRFVIIVVVPAMLMSTVKIEPQVCAFVMEYGTADSGKA